MLVTSLSTDYDVVHLQLRSLVSVKQHFYVGDNERSYEEVVVHFFNETFPGGNPISLNPQQQQLLPVFRYGKC